MMKTRFANPYYLILTFSVALAVMLIVWWGLSQERSFRSTQEDLLHNEVRSVASEVGRFVESRTRLIAAFAEDNGAVLRSVLDNPDEEVLLEQLEARLRSYFPGLFSFTISDETGRLVPDDLAGLVGELCRRDIKDFRIKIIEKTSTSTSHLYEAFVHPQAFNYHFDAMARWGGTSTQANILFVSFFLDPIARILKSYQVSGHRLALVRSDIPDLIEVMALGGRDKIDRPIRLSPSEIEMIVARQAVTASRWIAVGFPEPLLYEKNRLWIATQAGVLFAIVMIFFIGSLILIYRNEHQRLAALRELEGARDRAEEANRTKSEFLSVVSHELRTPLTSIKGTLGLLAKGAVGTLSDEMRSLIEIADRNSSRLHLLIDDLLDVEKIRAGKLECHMEPISVDEVVKSAVEVNQAYARNLGVEIRISENMVSNCRIMADETRIQQVLSNLLSNAAKFSPKGERVEVSSSLSDGWVRIFVTDQGSGIDPKFKHRIFEPFAQSDSSDTRTKGGTGLGLAISKAIVEEHGGKLLFDSTLGQGTAFHVELKVFRPPAGGI